MQRNFELASRKEATREKRKVSLHETELNSMFVCFNENLTSIEEKFSLIDRIMPSPDNDAIVNDIYRSQIVFLESALDYYMHNLGIYAMQQMYKKNWEKTSGYKDLKVNIETVIVAIENPENDEWIESAIITHHESKTYMLSKEIKGQLTLIFGKGMFDKVAYKLYPDYTLPGQHLSEVLDKYFSRRNKIAHQADRDHESNNKYSITRDYVEIAIKEIKNFVIALQACALEKIANDT